MRAWPWSANLEQRNVHAMTGTTPIEMPASDCHDRHSHMNPRKTVVIIGGGPAGIAAAIAANQIGLRSVVLDARMPPVDKHCGEGILPHGVAALHKLGICLDANTALPFAGIRFLDEESEVHAEFGGESGFALRRTRLHQLLTARAFTVGV